MNTEKLEILKDNAIAAYNGADAKGKAMLAKLFPNIVLTGKITDRVKTLLDACDIVKPDSMMTALMSYTGTDPDMISASNYAKIVIIARALNEGWTPDWNNSNQYKYVPWFTYKSGFGLSYDDYGYGHTATTVGSRLCFKTKELAEYAATQFADIYNDFLTIK